MNDSQINFLWSFVHGDIWPDSFREKLFWNMESGKDIYANLYSDLISLDSRSDEDVSKARNELRQYLRQTFPLESKIDNDGIELLWQFIRGDLAAQLFETWLYNNLNFKQQIGANFYLELILTNYQSGQEVDKIKNSLQEYLYKIYTNECYCITLSNLTVIECLYDMQLKYIDNFLNIKTSGKYNEQQLSQCPECKECWLKCSMYNEDTYLKRLKYSEAQKIINNNDWPKDFADYEAKILTARKLGRIIFL